VPCCIGAEKLDGVDKLFEEVLRISGSLEVQEALGKIEEFAGLKGKFDASAVGEEKKDGVENGGKGEDKDEAHGGEGGKVEQVKEGGAKSEEEVGTPRSKDGQNEAKAGNEDGQETKPEGDAGRDGERQEPEDVQGEMQGKAADENNGEENSDVIAMA
jgi:hypothetical protein